ncbi:Ig-like domain-containing protein [Granulosicoccaceae sp. 1_MG-2023]|nr:Ig-like domain-containing protein [Granulosicoccaceae sp. 1_MG-2023]
MKTLTDLRSFAPSVLALLVLSACSSGGGGSADSSDVDDSASDVTDVSAPEGTEDSYTVMIGGNLAIAAADGVLANDEGDSSSLSAELVDGPARAESFELNADGSFSYTPSGDEAGSDTFTYRVVDDNGESDSVLVTISILDEIAGGCVAYDAGEIVSGTLTAEGVDSPGFELISGPSLGTLTAFDEASGQYTYQRDSDQRGSDSFTYQVVDGFGEPLGTATQELIALPYRIMPVGDSITAGVSGRDYDTNQDLPYDDADRVAYRQYLKESLTDQGYSIDFVGSYEAGGNYFDDVQHNGIPGAHVSHIDTNISNWLYQDTADIILMHIGTNDTPVDDEDMAEVSSVFDQIADWDDANDHETQVVMAKIIARADYANKIERIPKYNALLDEFIPERQALGDAVYAVDMYTAMGGADAPYLSNDNLHPSSEGYEVMSEAWEETLIDNGLLRKCD